MLFFDALAKITPGNDSPGDPCEMGGEVMGTCVEVGACLRERGVFQRSGNVKLCRGQQGQIYICCRKPHLIAEELCDAWSHYWRGSDGRCEVDHPLIIGGTEANVGEFPHMALLGRKYKNNPINYNCGGTLISPHFVLTAAHCLVNFEETVSYWIKLGEHDLEHDASNDLIKLLKGVVPPSLYRANDLVADRTPDTVPVEQVILVDEVFLYPSYNFFLNYHDIALVRLVEPAKLTPRVLPACLPFQYPENDYLGEKPTVVGWGHTSGIREMSRTLQKVKVPVVDRLKCSVTKNNNDNTPLGITEDMLCAGEHGRDSCGGDSGGPLTIQVPRDGTTCEHTVVGVVSFGIGSGFSPCGALGVYGRVSSYLDWITGYIAPNGTDYQSDSIKH